MTGRGPVATSTGVDRGPQALPRRRGGAAHVARCPRSAHDRGYRMGGRNRCCGDRMRIADCFPERVARRGSAEAVPLDALGPRCCRSAALRQASHGRCRVGSHRSFQRHQCASRPRRSRSRERRGASQAPRRAPGLRPGSAAGRVRGRGGDTGDCPRGRCHLAGLCEIGRRWDDADIAWVAACTVAASMLAPYLGTITIGEVYVDRATIAGIESVTMTVGLRPIHGGRFALRPFPTVTARRLAAPRHGLRVAPWPACMRTCAL